MESFDSALKNLLHREPEDFLRFGLKGASLHVVGPLATTLPSRKREVDGTCLLQYEGTRLVAHLEFHRRHQSLEELAVDVAEAQVRPAKGVRGLVIPSLFRCLRGLHVRCPLLSRVSPTTAIAGCCMNSSMCCTTPGGRTARASGGR